MNADPAVLKKELWYLVLYLVISIPLLIFYLWLSRKARKEWLILMGQLKPNTIVSGERREYIRLDTVFPVEFQSIDGEKIGTLHEGFTRDISRIGMRIEAKTLAGRRLESFIPDRTKLKLTINLPIYAKPVEATGTVKWIQKLTGPKFDKYAFGVSYDDIEPEDASRVLKYALWLHRKPVFIGSVIALLILIIAVSSTFIADLVSSKRELEQKVKVSDQERRTLVDRIKEAELKKKELSSELRRVSERELLLTEEKPPLVEEGIIKEKKDEEEIRFSEMEAELESITEEKNAIQEELDYLEEEIIPEETPEEAPEETVEEEPASEEEDAPEETTEPNITDKMLKDEAFAYEKFRDYILKEDIQLLDRYCYQHESSMYHAASLFALAELRYKHKNDWLTVENTFKEVIKNYPKSKYASYASHRIEQIKKRLGYSTYTLRYFYMTYGLPLLLDYREIEPYKK